jgi:predicted membrane-bound spermidine synthase
VAGWIYGVSTLGSVFGTLLTTFTLIPAMGSRSITYLLAGITLLCGLSFFLAMPGRAGRSGRAGAVAVLAALVLLPAPGRAEPVKLFELYDSKSAERVLIESVESEYNNIFITQLGKFTAMSFRVRRREETESVIDRDDPDALPLPYTRAMTAALAYPDRLGSLLMIGLGGGTTTRYISRAVPALDITVAELDQMVVTMAKKHFKLVETKHYRVTPQDGRVYLMRMLDLRYDLVMVDAFRGGYVPFHLLTREFYKLLKRRLSPGGAAVFNVHGDNRLFESTLRTLSEVFGEVVTIPAAGAIITIVRNGPALSEVALRGRAAERQARYRFRYDLRYLLDWRKAIAVDPAARILTDDFAPVNLYRSVRKSNRKRR